MAFEGWNDAGEAASNAAGFVAEALSLAPLADVDGDEFFDFTVQRPDVRFDDRGERCIEWPAYEFRYGSVDGNDLVLAAGPEPHLRWRRFSSLVSDYVSELGVRRAVLLGAYLADVVYSRPVQVSGFSSSPEWMSRVGVQTSRYEGPTGIVGILAERLRTDGIEVLSLWAGLPHYISASPNPRGALALLQSLGDAVALKLDMSPMQRAADDFEERVSAMVAADPELTEYVRQLKRREFAQ